jgi:hypothetical protein
MNRLSKEKSPLSKSFCISEDRWYPWSEEALKARAEDKPVFLSRVLFVPLVPCMAKECLKMKRSRTSE